MDKLGMSTIYTPEYFLKKFEAIPEELWCKSYNVNEIRKDAYEHCDIPEHIALHDLFKQVGLSVFLIEDDDDISYQQPTPKLRILAALTDIINKQKQS